MTCLVGRTAALDAANAFLDRIGGGACALFLEGEPGIGKTRVWSEGVRLARERGYVVLRSRPAGADAEFAFAALADLLRDVVGEIQAHLPRPQRRSLAAALQFEDEPGATVDRYAVGAAVLGTLRLLAHDQAVVLAVDDAQWLDPASRDVLAFALRRLDDEPVGLLATVRKARDTSAEVVRGALPEQRVTRMRLEPLSVASLYEIVRDRFELALSRATLLRLHESSGGNPFYALEIARLLAERRRDPAPGEPLPVPDDLRELVRARLAQLTTRSAEVLLAAAALARPTVKVLGRTFGDADEALSETSSAGIVEVSGDTVRFSHPLLSSIHYESASRRARQRVHRRLASAAEDPDERARHLALASEEPSEKVAAELERAARAANRRGALAAAAELGELALERTEDGSARVPRTLLAADLRRALGQSAHARALLKEALQRTSDGDERGELLLKAAHIAAEESVEEALALAREGLLLAKDDGLRARLTLELGRTGRHLDFAEAVSHAADAVELAERSGDASILAEALSFLGRMRYVHTGELEREPFERAMALEDAAGTTDLETGAAMLLAETLSDAGDTVRARELLERVLATASARDDVAQTYALESLGSLDCAEGAWDRAAGRLREAAEIAAQGGRVVAEGRSLFMLAIVEAYRGNIEKTLELCARSTELNDQSGQPLRGPRLARGVLELSREDYEQAWDFLDPSHPRNGTQGMGRPRGQTPEAIEALIGLGRVGEARAMLDDFEDAARTVGRNWAIAVARRCRGVLAAAEGDHEAAEAILLDAARADAHVGSPFERARSLLALGTVQRRLRKKQAARATLGEALATFERLGARIWAGRAREELRRIGGRAAPAGADLSATEARIAELARSGRTNREIAEALSLSPKTVEWNLSKIYRKLGVRSRTELAARG